MRVRVRVRVRVRGLRLRLTGVSVVLAAACTAPSSPQAAREATSGSRPGAGSEAGVSLDCNAIGDQLPTSDRVVVLGALALPAPQAPALQAHAQEGASAPELAYFAKAGLGFKAGSRWRLSVAPEDRDHLRIGWGSPADPSIVIGPPTRCRPATPTGWLWYPGGYWTDQPGCYAIVVQVDEQSRRVRIGVGEPCPGQDPPAGSQQDPETTP